MDKTHYRQLQAATNDVYMQAWRFVLENWNCKDWQAIPNQIRLTLSFPASLGMCNGQLVTRIGANGMNEFISRMNNRKM